MAEVAIPAFDDLPINEKLGLRHAWDVFGRDDQLGTINFLTPERRRAAAHSVRTGDHYSLVAELVAIEPPLYGREPMVHTIFAPDRNGLDERLDGYYLQSGSHWDGLRHVRAREEGFWGGFTDAEKLVPRTGPLGIERWVEHGFMGRGVLLDVGRYFAAREPGYDPFVKRSVTGADLSATAQAQGTELRPGDILCIRLGWMGRYMALDAAGKEAASMAMEFAGLAADEDMSRWLWNQQAAAVACDNPAVEVSPGDARIGSLHRRLIPFLGFALGELFSLDDLATACAADGNYDFLFVSVPLRLAGGVGSPANASAIR